MIPRYALSLALITSATAALALLEFALARRPPSPWRRAHLPANLGLMAATLALNLALSVAAAVASDALRARGIGLLATRSLSPFALLLLAIIALDLATWAAHWTMHRVPALWRAHRVHHADPLVDVTTALRQHPLEGLLRFAFILVPAVALGLPAETVAAYRLLSAMNSLLEHADLRLWPPLDRALSALWVTPGMHKVHHSRHQPETDSNYGNLLSVFDRAFGTFTPSSRAGAAAVEYGLHGYDTPRVQRLGALLRLPFRRDA